MNPILNKILGGAMMAGGALSGNGRLGRAGFNRFTAPQTGFNYWAGTNANPTAPQVNLPTLGAAPQLDTAQLPYSTGGGSPRPAFRMPSAGGYSDPETMQ